MPLALALLVAAAMQQTPTFAVGVEAVYVDVFVTDRHGPTQAAGFAIPSAGFTIKSFPTAAPLHVPTTASCELWSW